MIRHHKPDVIFLDIEMPRMSGMRMLDELKDYAGEVIFTTAYAHYAVDAIRISAFDYLVKPVSIGNYKMRWPDSSGLNKVEPKKGWIFYANLVQPVKIRRTKLLSLPVKALNLSRLKALSELSQVQIIPGSF